tara:strand:- start:321 stop:827 length:507 start_codon:yes stop_codon:yes gene_type:complete
MKKERLLKVISNKYLIPKVAKSFDMKIIKAFDFDDTLFTAVGTYEQDYDLEKFKKDNTFFKNLFTKELPLAKKLRQAKKKGDIIVIITAREQKWWFKLLLWLKRIPYDYVRERPKTRQRITTHELKKEQLIDIVSKHGSSYYLDFYDDSKINCDTIEQGVKFATVHKI